MKTTYSIMALGAALLGLDCRGYVAAPAPGASTGAGNGSAGSGGSTSPTSPGQPGPTDPTAMSSVALPPAPTSIPTANACQTGAPGPRRMRRLSATEFAASIRSIFADQTAPVATVFSDPTALGFSVDANALLVQGLNASQLMDNAEAIASWAVTSGKLSAFASCTTVDATCARQFVEGFGRRAFRATLVDSDPRVAPYVQLFTAESSFADGAQAVISAMLQSPYFLYRSELGTAAGADFALTPFEVAGSLAYLLTGDMPDDPLLDAADAVASGSVQLPAMVDAQATRLLTPGSPTHDTAIVGFMTGWLGLDRLYTTAKDDSVYMLTDALRDEMATETRSLILEAFDQGGSAATQSAGGFASLLTSDHSFLNQDLATFYGLDATGLTSAFVRVPYTSATHRDGGLLAQATILNGYARPDASSPTQRGHLVRSRILCQAVPPPPANVDTTLKPIASAQTTRQRIEAEHSLGACDACHKLMDPIGFGFEHYDGFGRYRDSENGVAIDATGTVVNANAAGASATFDGLGGAGGLAAYLSTDPDVNQCLVRYWSYDAFGSASWDQDGCTYDAISQEAAGQGFSLRGVLMAILHAPSFTRRVQDH
jgi:hypothetical protein